MEGFHNSNKWSSRRHRLDCCNGATLRRKRRLSRLVPCGTTSFRSMLPVACKTFGRAEKSLSMRQPDSVPSLARLGLIVGSILVGVVLLFHVGYSSTTIALAPKSSAPAVGQVNHPAKLQSQATS